MSVGAQGWVFLVLVVLLFDTIAFIVGSQSMSTQFGAWLEGWTKFPVIIGWLALTVHLFWELFQ